MSQRHQFELEDSIPFEELLTANRAGDHDRWVRALERILPLVMTAIRKRFGGTLPPDYSASAAVQSAYRVLSERFDAGEFRLEHEGDLFGLLLFAAKRKCWDAIKKKHVITVEFLSGEEQEKQEGIAEPKDRNPTPAQALCRKELREQLVQVWNEIEEVLPDYGADILRGWLNGRTREEMATDLGVSTRTVDRRMQQIRNRLLAYRQRFDEQDVETLQS